MFCHRPYLKVSLVVLLILGFGLVYYIQKPTVSTGIKLADRPVVLADKTWNLQFSRPIKKETVNEENIFVTDSSGKKVPVKLELQENQESLLIHAPKEGYPLETEFFTLHISNNVKSTFGFSVKGNKDIEFAVKQTLPVIESKNQLTRYFKEVMKKEEENRNTLPFARQENAEMSKSSADSNQTDTAQSSNEGFSQTNNQVEGVDEGDIVKTDGEYIYQLKEQKLVITKALPAEELNVVSSITVKGNFSPRQLFLQEDKLIVIGNSWGEPVPHKKSQASPNIAIMPVEGVTKAFVYDITNQEKPKLVREIGLEGHFVSARQIDSTLYFIANHSPNYWNLEKEQKTDLRPKIYDSEKSDSLEPIALNKIKYMPQSMETNFTLIGSLDINEDSSEFKVESYLGSGNQLYMSQENLYIAVTKYTTEKQNEWAAPNTEIYKFTVNGTGVQFDTRGEVTGTVLNQFSMDEYNGYFRVATTEGEVWNEKKPSANHLFVLDENMKQVGSVEGLARGEQIYSVRFMGDKTYVVTFKQVDPLFVIDTSKPEQPKVLGKLKIPGFSTYLHPIDENHLIGFGVDTKVVENKNGNNKEPLLIRGGMKISLFDVTDFTNPKETDTEIIGGRGTHSPLLADHKALFHYPKDNLYGFPISIYNNKEGSDMEQTFSFQGALMYEITPENGIVSKAKLADESKGTGLSPYEGWENQIQRLIYIKDKVYTISNSEVAVYTIGEFKKMNSVKLQ
jgi:inhibitor of cysteine peptidase